MEDKQKICDLLLVTLQATRNLKDDLVALRYEKRDNGRESVKAVFKTGYCLEINVTLDSGTAMIRDIMRYLE